MKVRALFEVILYNLEILSSANNILTKELGQEMRLLGVRLSNLKFLDDRLMERTVFVAAAYCTFQLRFPTFSSLNGKNLMMML